MKNGSWSRTSPANAGGARASGAPFPASRREVRPRARTSPPFPPARLRKPKSQSSFSTWLPLARCGLRGRSDGGQVWVGFWTSSSGPVVDRCWSALGLFGALWSTGGPISVRFWTDFDQFLSAALHRVPPRARASGAVECSKAPPGAVCFPRSSKTDRFRTDFGPISDRFSSAGAVKTSFSVIFGNLW
jgi:hypothetical protein